MKNITLKQFLMIITILLCWSCTKQEACIGSPSTCTHTVNYAYLACPDPFDSSKWIYSNVKSYTETFEITDCDTSAWLAETRRIDENWKHDPNNNTWEEFARLYPNECGCQ